MLKRIRSLPSPALAIAVFALVVAVGGGSFALAGGGGLNKKIAKISRKQANKVFNKRRGQLVGPQGPKGDTGAKGEKGDTGAKGAQGDEGPRGPSNGYEAFKDNVGLLASGSLTTIGSLAVPAGSYIVSAKLMIANEGSDRSKTTCELFNDLNGDKDRSEVTTDPIESTFYFGRAMVTLQAASAFSSSGHWQVKCLAQGSTPEIQATWLKIQAIQVGDLSVTNA